MIIVVILTTSPKSLKMGGVKSRDFLFLAYHLSKNVISSSFGQTHIKIIQTRYYYFFFL